MVGYVVGLSTAPEPQVSDVALPGWLKTAGHRCMRLDMSDASHDPRSPHRHVHHTRASAVVNACQLRARTWLLVDLTRTTQSPNAVMRAPSSSGQKTETLLVSTVVAGSGRVRRRTGLMPAFLAPMPSVGINTLPVTSNDHGLARLLSCSDQSNAAHSIAVGR
jgi:hypothetical protein